MSDARRKYESDGYHVARGIVAAEKIDAFLRTFADVAALQPELQFPIVSTLGYGPLRRINGFMQDPVFDVHSLGWLRDEFSPIAETALEMMTCDGLKEQLLALDGSDAHTLVMSTFVDRSSGTAPHQDCYYLDSDPQRRLTAAWIALEDIAPEAGRFYVISGSHKKHFDLTAEQLGDSKSYEKLLADYVAARAGDLYSPELKKGDVLFWNSGTVHGAYKPSSETTSRKSFTVHYIPNSVNFVRHYNAEKLTHSGTFARNGIVCRVDRLTAKMPA